jgi:hypothetical protein
MQSKDLAGLAIVLLLSACGATDVASHPTGTVSPPVGGAAGTFGAVGTGLPGSGAGGTGVMMAGTQRQGISGAGAMAGAGGVKAPGTPGAGGAVAAAAGRGAAGAGAAGKGGAGGPTGMPTPPGNMDPIVPALTATCPDFAGGTITFMGLGGIDVVSGPMPATASAPMVFYWHGTGSTSGEYAFMATAVQQGVVSEGGVLVSFDSTTGGDGLSGTAIFGAGDFMLTDQLLACAVKNHNVDPRRVFTMGCSAGGLFSVAMATLRSSYIAAAAPNSGGTAFPSAFENKHTPALMTVHGMAGQDVVGIDFASASATADQAFKAAGGFVIDCDTGGGHCGGGGLAGDVWTFFKAHPFGVSPEPWSTLPSGFSTQCKIQ